MEWIEKTLYYYYLMGITGTSSRSKGPCFLQEAGQVLKLLSSFNLPAFRTVLVKLLSNLVRCYTMCHIYTPVNSPLCMCVYFPQSGCEAVQVAFGAIGPAKVV